MSNTENIDVDRFEPHEDVENKKKNDLVEWDNPPRVADLEGNIKDAQQDLSVHISNVEKWIRARDAVLKVNPPRGYSRLSPKFIRRQNEWRYASLAEPLLSTNDMFNVNPATRADTDTARVHGNIINYQFRNDIDKVGFINNYIRTAVDEGVVIVRVGWSFKEERVTRFRPVMVEVIAPEVRGQIQQLMQKREELVNGYPPEQIVENIKEIDNTLETLSQNVVTVPSGEYEEYTAVETVENKPTLDICQYDRVTIDPTCEGDFSKAKFIGYTFYSSLSDLIEDGKYKNLDKLKSKNGEKSIDEYSDAEFLSNTAGQFKFKDEARKKLKVTEYWGDWDIDNSGIAVPIVATYCNGVMIRLEENPFPDRKPPFVKAVYLPKRNDIYGGEPDAVLIEDHQDTIGSITRGMVDLMGRSANAQQGISANALDPAQKHRFENNLSFVFNPEIDPAKAFYMAKYPEIPKSAIEMIQMQQSEAEALTGIRPFLNNVKGPDGAESRNAMDATAKREIGILRRMISGIEQIGMKIMAMNSANLSDEEVIRITDDDGVQFDRTTLAGKYDLVVDVSTPEIDAERANDLGFIMQTIGPNMDPKLQGKVLGKLARLKKLPDLAEDLENYEPPVDPRDAEIKDLQIELLKAQIKNENSKGDDKQADTVKKYAEAELDGAKKVTELAKARALDSGSDLTDLDFIDKNDGISHDREIDLQDKKANDKLNEIGAQSLLQSTGGSETHTKVRKADVPASSGSHIRFATGGDSLRGMDTPQENLVDSISVP